MDVLSDANELVNALARAEILENIEKVLKESPGGQYLFVHISEQEKDGDSWLLMQTDSSTDDIGTQLYIAQSFTHTLLNGVWPTQPHDEED